MKLLIVLILIGVPQGSNLSPNLYHIFTSEIPINSNTVLATYADDIAILSINNNLIAALKKPTKTYL
jgi:hypothetical protein